MGHRLRYLIVIALCLLLLISFSNISMARTFKGRFTTYMYGYESTYADSVRQHLHLYEAFNLNIEHLSNKHNLDFNTYLRWDKDIKNSDDDSPLEIYSLYFDWKIRQKSILLRSGRQFVSTGVGIGHIDGMSLRWQMSKKITYQIFYGRRATLTDGIPPRRLLGSSFSFRFGRGRIFNVSWMSLLNKDGWTKTNYAFDTHYRIFYSFNTYFIFNYDATNKKTEIMRLGAKYSLFHNKLRLYGEYSNVYPTFESNSLFNNFNYHNIKEFRFGGYWNIRRNITLHSELLSKQFNSGNGQQLKLSLISRFGKIGFLSSSGHEQQKTEWSYAIQGKLFYNFFYRFNFKQQKFFTDELEHKRNARIGRFSLNWKMTNNMDWTLGSEYLKNTEYNRDIRLFTKLNINFKKGENNDTIQK